MAPTINQVPRLAFPGMEPRQQQHLNQLVDAVNSLSGHNGPIQLNDHLDLAGNRVMNVGAPVEAADAVSHIVAQRSYSATALRPQLEANGSTPLQSVRRINDSTQREQVSTWLNQVMSTPPNASTAQVAFMNSGGSTIITVNATNLIRADGSLQPLAGRTDTVSRPTAYTIVSITRVAGLVTATFGAGPPISAGQIVGVIGVTDSSFDGAFVVTGAVGVTLTWNQGLADASSSGGTVSIGGVYYYFAIPGNPTMFMAGPFSADTPQNRINASNDNKQIIAVAVVNSGGGVNAQSGGGGTPTTGAVNAGTFF